MINRKQWLGGMAGLVLVAGGLAMAPAQAAPVTPPSPEVTAKPSRLDNAKPPSTAKEVAAARGDKVVPAGKGASNARAVESDIVKGMPDKSTGKASNLRASYTCIAPPTCYNYASVSLDQANTTAVSADVRVAAPSLDQTDYHTLFEMTIQNGNDIIEWGWTRDRALHGETFPTLTTRLFAGVWYDNGTTRQFCGYNGGCGYTDYGPNPVNLGHDITAKNGQAVQFQIVGTGSEWWLRYDAPNDPTTSGWVGYFPKDLGQGRNFTSGTLMQSFGEIAARRKPSCTDMGNSWLATATGTYPTHGADMTGYNTKVNLGSWAITNFAPGVYATEPTKWQGINLGTGLRYGGPGWSPNPGACPA